MFGIARAPDFDRAGLTWFNVDTPLRLSDLAGRIVILDFWTFCCINCFHVLPTLRRIEEAFPTEVAVIGVHSPKFDHEQDPQAVQAAIARYDIRHPVVHDPYRTLWQEYCVRAWPTLVFVSPDGHVIGELPGEPHPDMLLQGVGDMVAQFWARGEMRPTTLPLAVPAAGGGSLRFPGKIKRCGPGLWAIADTGHHQIVVADDAGREVARYGSGMAGFTDGPGAEATFNGPEGLVCDDSAIWVADTRNHAIRRIDRAGGQVETVAGIGCRGGVLRHPEPATGAALASPWDLALVDGVLYFANAGSHQLGALDPERGMVRAVAGNGSENIVDGPADHAELAQPSGLEPDGAGGLYFADSETSALRRLVPGAAPRVETVVGVGLFDFGHANGPLARARLQHPLGLAVAGQRVYVADSYNGGIRVVDLAAGAVSDLEVACADPLCFPSGEPAGIAIDGGRLLVSDTNNHRIVEIRLDQGISRTWMN